MRDIFFYLVYCIRPFIQEKPMSERKNSKSRRNYLVKCSCPNCTQESEHSFSRVQKGALLICPHCNKVFQTNLKAVAWLILLIASVFIFYKSDNKKPAWAGLILWCFLWESSTYALCFSIPAVSFCCKTIHAANLHFTTMVSIFFLIKILPNMLAIISCIEHPYFLLKRSNIHHSVCISTQASAFFVIVYRRAMIFNQ